MLVLPLPPHLLLRGWLATRLFQWRTGVVIAGSASPIDRELYINRKSLQCPELTANSVLICPLLLLY
ncbi:hypothetical protein T01_11050 [Trichinella spiralis]|uniref:Uncharacterized protein n=1 Tax=Trichinella spiralis TaxID=6334 RepID=A0A0V1BXE2_TRISP|nr:hypothetical protein T01_11050 [Trichinella spiralis]